MSYGNWGFLQPACHVSPFRGICGIWYGIPLMYTPGVFPLKGQTVEIFRKKSSSVFSPPGLDMTQDRSDVRFSESPWQQHPKRRDELQPFTMQVVVFFAMERGVKNICSSTWEFISYSYEIYKWIIGNSWRLRARLTNESSPNATTNWTTVQSSERRNRRNFQLLRRKVGRSELTRPGPPNGVFSKGFPFLVDGDYSKLLLLPVIQNMHPKHML